MRKIVVWTAALTAAAACLATPAAAAPSHWEHLHRCHIKRLNERECVLRFELQMAQTGSIQDKSGSVMIQSLNAFQKDRPIGFVVGTVSSFNTIPGPGEGIFTLRLSDRPGQVSVQFAQLANAQQQQPTPLIVTGGSGVFKCVTGSGAATGGGSSGSPIFVKLQLKFLCGSHRVLRRLVRTGDEAG